VKRTSTELDQLCACFAAGSNPPFASQFTNDYTGPILLKKPDFENLRFSGETRKNSIFR
jgi:hypothetical protein